MHRYLVRIVLALAPTAAVATDLVAFSASQAARQGSFEAAGVRWSCEGELCRAPAPDDVTRWPLLCEALVREIGPVVAFGALGNRFDAQKLALCNRTATTTPSSAPPPSTPAPAPTYSPDSPGAPAAAPNRELCNGHDDDGDGEVDEGVRMTVWADRDRDLYGDSAKPRSICPHELAPGWVVDDSDCDDSNRRRNPGRDNCN